MGGPKLSNINYSEFGARICQYCIRANLSQQKLADLLGISYQHMSNIECGHAKPSLELAVKISSLLNIDLNILVGNNEKIYSSAILCSLSDLLEDVSSDDLQICYAICEAYIKTKAAHNR